MTHTVKGGEAGGGGETRQATIADGRDEGQNLFLSRVKVQPPATCELRKSFKDKLAIRNLQTGKKKDRKVAVIFTVPV